MNKLKEIIKASEHYFYIVSDGKIYESEGYSSDIVLGDEVYDLSHLTKEKELIIKELEEQRTSKGFEMMRIDTAIEIVKRGGKE